MFLAMLVAAAAAGSQAAPTLPGPGRFFVSPMGEPFYGRKAGEDGLVVWFEQADSNRDGNLTAEEIAADADRFFAVLDRQKDGEIDPDDINYYETAITPQMRVQSIVTVKDLPGGGQSEHVDDETSSGLYGLLKIPQPVASADTNFNRGVSTAEFRAAAQRRFRLLDGAGVGRLSLAQLENMRRAAIAASKRRPANPTDSSEGRAAEYGAPSH